MKKVSPIFLEKMKLLLSNDEYDLYIKSLDDDPIKGFTMSKSKFLYSTLNMEEFLREINGKILYENNEYYYINSNIISGKSPYFHSGLIYIQEPSASYPLKDIKLSGNEKILDLCASPGGKSVQFLYSLDRGGFIVLNEFDYKRANILKSNIERMGFINYIISNNSSSELSKIYNKFFDIILVDAPCSGEGMFRKSVEAINQWNENLVFSCQKIQKTLLEDAYSMLNNNGILIYSTCTFSKEEDEDNINLFLKQHSDMNIISQNKIFPFMNIGEGQYYAIMKKKTTETEGIAFENKRVKNKNINQNLIKDYLSDFLIKVDKYFDEKYSFEIVNEDIYIKQNDEPLSKNLNVVSKGIKILEKKKNRYEITHHFSHFVDKADVKKVIDLDDEDIRKYLKGESVYCSKEIEDGYCLITYRGLNMGIGKLSNKLIKNHYPKGLRNF